MADAHCRLMVWIASRARTATTGSSECASLTRTEISRSTVHPCRLNTPAHVDAFAIAVILAPQRPEYSRRSG